VLRRQGLERRFQADPAGVLEALHDGLAAGHDVERLSALAELSFLHAGGSGDRRYYLAAAVYAYAALFSGDGALPFAPTDPRLRLVYDLYNRGLAEGLTGPDGAGPVLDPGPRALPFGLLEIESDPSSFRWAGYRLEGFESAARLKVHGLQNRYRRPGIGAPMSARLGAPDLAVPPETGYRRIPSTLRVASTAFLRIEAPRSSLASGRLRGRLEVYTADASPAVSVQGRLEPLEYETTAALADSFSGVSVWDVEVGGFFGVPLPVPAGRPNDGLLLVGPYRRGRIPLVLVHGTVSSPIRWAELINELQNDPRLGPAYQIWVFIYNSGNPIFYSAGLLRHALETTVREVDPDGIDPALRQMVVIGHSQGGLLTKMTAIDSGTRLWDEVSDVPIDEFDVDAETRAVLRRSTVVTPLPFVRRVVFLATPHRGSELTYRLFRRLLSVRLRLPSPLAENLAIFDRPEMARIRKVFEDVPTSLEGMRPDNPVGAALAAIPIAPGIAAHSVIAIQGDGPPEQGGDGVVRYASAHLDGVDSERIVRSGHSLQANPETIEEIRRILRLHLTGVPP
jgi:hypothetical protein